MRMGVSTGIGNVENIGDLDMNSCSSSDGKNQLICKV